MTNEELKIITKEIMNAIYESIQNTSIYYCFSEIKDDTIRNKMRLYMNDVLDEVFNMNDEYKINKVVNILKCKNEFLDDEMYDPIEEKRLSHRKSTGLTKSEEDDFFERGDSVE